MFNRILTVCVGNICRSPTAEFLLKEALADDRFSVSSAGIGALANHPIDEKALAVLTAKGFTPPAHSARQLDRKILSDTDLVLAMEQRHIDHILGFSPEARGKIFLLGKWQGNREIADPYRKDEQAFLTAYTQILEGAQAWAARIKP